MMSPSQYLTPDRGRGYGGVREGLSPRADLFGAAGDISRLASPEFTSTPAAAPSQPWAARADQALLAPSVWQRCEELGPLLQQCPSKELANIWHTVVDRIFGLGGGRGWGLGQITRTQTPRDYTALASFLSASGPLMEAGSRLLADPYIRYDFPVSRLSPSVTSQISSGSPGLSSYLASRLSHNMQNLTLNSFELLMFSFSVYIVQPYSQDNKLVAGESLYPFILEDYLSYYLPCDGTIPPPLPFQLPSGSHSPSHATDLLSPACSPAVSSPARRSLLRHQPAAAAVSRPPPPPVTSQASSDTAWRSETLLNIFSCVWLSQFSSKPSSPGSGLTSTELPIPVSDTLKIVRMLIKHLHYFANSGGPQDVTPLDQLKRATLPGVKCQMFSLFKYIFTHWPHDTSFRLVLETWLSFIQPWRYTDRGRPAQDTDAAHVAPERWQLWVAEFILFYTEIIKLLLPRFFRMDLTASRNAYMLYRIAKVFSQPGVADLVKNAEGGLDRGNKGSHGMPSLLEAGSLVLEQDKELVTGAARQCLLELEGHSVKYKAVFGNEFRQTVVELVAVSERARGAAEETLKELGESSGGQREEGLVSRMLRWLAATGDSEDRQETEELRKTVHHLTASMAGLQEVFSVAATCPERDGGTVRRLTGSPGQPEMVQTERGLVLTPHGRWQVVQGLARTVPRYEGDPDTRPITQQEIVWLVRLLHQASQHLNNKHGDLLQRYYHEAGLQGQAARLLLAPPTHYVTTTKSISGGPAVRSTHHHRARISLRTFGNKRTIFYLFLYLMLMWLQGYSTFGAVFILILLMAFIVFLTASVKQVTQPRLSLLDTSDISPHNISSPDKKSL